jgi:hypothetical protein
MQGCQQNCHEGLLSLFHILNEEKWKKDARLQHPLASSVPYANVINLTKLNPDNRGSECGLDTKFLRLFEHLDGGFEFHYRYGCMTAFFCVCVVMCSYQPCDGLIPCPRSPTTCL